MELLRAHPPVHFARNLESMIGLARQHRFQILLATWAHSPHMKDYAATPHYARCYEEMNRTVVDVATRNQIPVFDFASVMPAEPRYWSDGRHVNEEGAARKAALFAEFIHSHNLVQPL